MADKGHGWTHSICDDCWDKQRPESPSPHAGMGEQEVCCWCGSVTWSGIYLRADPATCAAHQDVGDPDG